MEYASYGNFLFIFNFKSLMLLLPFFLVYSGYLSIFHQLVLFSRIFVVILVKSALIQPFVHHIMKLMAMMYI